MHIALIHYPVVNKNGAIIASAITNLDLHDIARAAKTFALRSFQVVTPLEDQQVLAGRIVSHWTRGAGGAYNPRRREALMQITISATLEEAIQAVGRQEGRRPCTVATCAQPQPHAIGFDQLRQTLQSDAPHMLLMGTAWGLAPEILVGADHVLAPIGDHAAYNHLSVRCAAAIIMDRLNADAPPHEEKNTI
ncbi:MAG: RNA methyltransferase [Desulfobacterales bacterium]|nr:RNA methyltransferase [Desulfobacterales bacterium]